VRRGQTEVQFHPLHRRRSGEALDLDLGLLRRSKCTAWAVSAHLAGASLGPKAHLSTPAPLSSESVSDL
jgi:hypothetical protein